MHLTKLHGLGNDFLVLLDQPADPMLARRLCDRRTGVGADGLLVGTEGGPDEADITMTLFNADGRTAAMSGNGIRCLAHALYRHLGASSELPILVSTDAGLRSVVVRPTEDPLVVEARVDMGVAVPGPTADLTAPPARPGAIVPDHSVTVDIGNPHLVHVVWDVGQVQVDVDGPREEAAYSDGINVEWIAPDPDADGMDLVVWERGAGHTLACGTGACAAAHAAHGLGLVGDRVEVRMEGGDVLVELGDTIHLTGPSAFVADLEVP